MGSILTKEDKALIGNHLSTIFGKWNITNNAIQAVAQPSFKNGELETWISEADQEALLQKAVEQMEGIKDQSDELADILNQIVSRL